MRLQTNLSKAQGLNNIIIPFYALPAFTDVSPTGGDVTLLLRQTALISNAIYDATAPYMDTAVGIYSRLPRQTPPPEDNNKVLNTALLFSVYRVLLDVLPTRAVRWRRMLSTVGLDPDNDSTTPNGPAGIGNAAGKAVVAGRANDGANARGLRDRKYNPRPFEVRCIRHRRCKQSCVCLFGTQQCAWSSGYVRAEFTLVNVQDYTGYVPVNTPDEVVDPSRWQPYVSRRGVGIYAAQRFVTPQWALVEPYFLGDDTAKYKVLPQVVPAMRLLFPATVSDHDAVCPSPDRSCTARHNGAHGLSRVFGLSGAVLHVLCRCRLRSRATTGATGQVTRSKSMQCSRQVQSSRTRRRLRLNSSTTRSTSAMHTRCLRRRAERHC